jgi:hypothetical protein
MCEKERTPGAAGTARRGQGTNANATIYNLEPRGTKDLPRPVIREMESTARGWLISLQGLREPVAIPDSKIEFWRPTREHLLHHTGVLYAAMSNNEWRLLLAEVCERQAREQKLASKRRMSASGTGVAHAR